MNWRDFLNASLLGQSILKYLCKGDNLAQGFKKSSILSTLVILRFSFDSSILLYKCTNSQLQKPIRFSNSCDRIIRLILRNAVANQNKRSKRLTHHHQRKVKKVLRRSLNPSMTSNRVVIYQLQSQKRKGSRLWLTL